MIELNRIYNEDCLEGMKRIPDGSIDCILTDPPYLYLKGQKLDRPFDEKAFFASCKRVLKKDGFIVLFGRGTSFYRWNTLLADMGFCFKEEIVWDKRIQTSPFLPIGRVHETVSIHTPKNGCLRRVKEPYIEVQKFDLGVIAKDVERIMSAVKTNGKELRELKEFLTTGNAVYTNVDNSYDVTGHTKKKCTVLDITNRMLNGIAPKDIVREFEPRGGRIHPTQKPVRLLERLMELCSDVDSVVLDPFMGSASTAVACMNSGRNFIGFEIDPEYYERSSKRIQEHQPRLAL